MTDLNPKSCSSEIQQQKLPDPTTLHKKVMAGYQGWFFTPNDGGLNEWRHWSHKVIPDEKTITFDLWPDLREYDFDELCPTAFTYKDGSNAGLYSAYNQKTVQRHCRWMHDYDMDGVFVQRFLTDVNKMKNVKDEVLTNVQKGCEKFGRVFANMYDISGNWSDSDTVIQDLIEDWKHLVDNLQITKSKNYLFHNGRPLLAIWGFGFRDRVGEPSDVSKLINWLKNEADERYRVTLMGGVPCQWREHKGDSKTDEAWASIYRSFDVISPWTVGRMKNIDDVNSFRSNYLEPDLKECDRLGKEYLPVIFPGFSSSNLKPSKVFNEIPRRGGTFFWRQIYNVIDSGNDMIYVAMFDEVDEGTAVFKIAENEDQAPTKGHFLTLGADPEFPVIPSDWYLRLIGHATKAIREGSDVSSSMPDLPPYNSSNIRNCSIV